MTGGDLIGNTQWWQKEVHPMWQEDCYDHPNDPHLLMLHLCLCAIHSFWGWTEVSDMLVTSRAHQWSQFFTGCDGPSWWGYKILWLLSQARYSLISPQSLSWSSACLARNWGKPLANNQYVTEVLSPIAPKELNLDNTTWAWKGFLPQLSLELTTFITGCERHWSKTSS